MRHYEIVIMFHPDRSDQVSTMLERYRSMVTDTKGTIHRLEDWGRRQLAYPINKLHKAHYILMNVECDKGIVAEFRNLFRFNDAILRHLILSREEAITEPSQMLDSRDDKAKSLLGKPARAAVTETKASDDAAASEAE